MEMVENKMVVDSEWNDWLSNPGYDPYEDASEDAIISFLINANLLHKVVAGFLDADAGCYDELSAEELFLEYMNSEGRSYLLRKYLDRVDIGDKYNEWYFRYHTRESYD